MPLTRCIRETLTYVVVGHLFFRGAVQRDSRPAFLVIQKELVLLPFKRTPNLLLTLDRCIPDTLTYTSLMAAFSSEERYNDMADLLFWMEDVGTLPDVTAYNILINAYGKVRTTTAFCALLQKSVRKYTHLHLSAGTQLSWLLEPRCQWGACHTKLLNCQHAVEP